jgi:hypothetical protein
MATSFIGGGNQSTQEKSQPAASHRQTLSQNVVSSTPHHERNSNLTTLVVMGTHCIGRCKSNYQTITTTIPLFIVPYAN